MDRDALIEHWKDFFRDLFLGTFKRIFSLGILGYIIGIATTYPLDFFFIEALQITDWIQWLSFLLALIWYGFWGTFHGLMTSLFYTGEKKMKEMIGGLQGIFDFFSRAAIKSLPKGNKIYSKEEVAQKFELIGQEFQKDLRLKGWIGILSSLLFGFILKSLKFLFIDEIAEKVLTKSGKEVSAADIEAAIRRVGVDTLLSPISDQFFFLHILNLILFSLTFSLPFFILWII